MSKSIPLTVIITSCCNFLCAQNSSTLMGARAAALGYAASCIGDEWSVLNNIGALARVKETAAAFSYNALPSFAPFNKSAAVFALSTNFGVAGFGLFHFGNSLYSEQLVTLGFSNTFGLASLGARINYVQYNAQGFGRKAVWTLGLGGTAALTPKLTVGAYITNINQPSLTDQEKLPTLLTAGISFKPSDNTLIVTEIEKDIDFGAVWRTGIEYKVYKKISFRTGFNINPNTGFFGFGFRPKKFSCDYAFQYNNAIGGRHEASVSYKFNVRRK